MDVNNEYGCREIQVELLEMLKDFHAFCQNYDLKYSLCGGSLLGAVRHNGFIPWDDDLDVMMDRNYYTKFLSVAQKMKGYSVEKVLWVYRIRKTTSVDEPIPTIDLFVMDVSPNNTLIRFVKTNLIRVLQGMIKKEVDYSSYAPIYKMCIAATHILGCFFAPETKQKLFEKVSQIGSRENADFLTAYNDLYKLLKIRYDGRTMDNLELHSFENTTVFITQYFDSYLTKQYGDYMTPPPIEERKPGHGDAQSL